VSVVEKAAPRRPIAIGAAALALIVLLAVIVTTVALRSPDDGPTASASTTQPSPASTSADPPDATFAPRAPSVPVDVGFDPGASYRVYLHRRESSATVHVFAYIDLASGELRYVDERAGDGFVRARIGDTLVLESPDHLGFIDRGFTRERVAVGNGLYVGAWRDHAVVADSFPERTTFRVYDRTGREQRTVALVGRAPDLIAGVVRDAVVVARGGRIILVGLTDSTVRPFAVGNLLGVGGDRTTTRRARCRGRAGSTRPRSTEPFARLPWARTRGPAPIASMRRSRRTARASSSIGRARVVRCSSPGERSRS
jgi:hypothetical protein